MESCAGMLAVGLGAYGSHMFKPSNPSNRVVSVPSILLMFWNLHLFWVCLCDCSMVGVCVCCCFKCTYDLSALVYLSGVADSKQLSLGSYGSPSCGSANEATSCGKFLTFRLWLRIRLLT